MLSVRRARYFFIPMGGSRVLNFQRCLGSVLPLSLRGQVCYSFKNGCAKSSPFRHFDHFAMKILEQQFPFHLLGYQTLVAAEDWVQQAFPKFVQHRTYRQRHLSVFLSRFDPLGF